MSGLWGRPTVVNNVETICNIPGIVANGVEWYQALGKGDFVGTVFRGSVAGSITPVAGKFLLASHSGNCWKIMPVGCRTVTSLKASYPVADLLISSPEHLDLPMDPGAVQKPAVDWAPLIMVLDDKTSAVGCVRNLIKFFAHESCGWCTPCRDGLPGSKHILNKMVEGKGLEKDIEILQEMTTYMGPGNTFALAPGAQEPLQSALKHFMHEFEACVASD